jgi:hypothetical protein
MLGPMKQMLAPLLALAAFAAPASAAERRYTITDFDRVVVEGPYAVTLATGDASSAVASGSQHALERVLIDVQGRTLRIRPNRNAWGGHAGDPAGRVTVALRTRDLRSASVAGSGSLAIDGARGLRVDFAVEGSGRIAADRIEADSLVVALVGSGNMRLGGTAKELRANVQGAGDLDAGELRTEGARIDSGSAGNIRVSVTRNATVNSFGAGDVEIVGAPACTVNARGAGEVRCGRSDQRQPR